MSKKKESKFFSRMDVAAKQLAEMAIEQEGTSVLFIATENPDVNGLKHITQAQGSTAGIVIGLVEFATNPETAPIFTEVLTLLSKQNENN
jgi:hypothetical protein